MDLLQEIFGSKQLCCQNLCSKYMAPCQEDMEYSPLLLSDTDTCSREKEAPSENSAEFYTSGSVNFYGLPLCSLVSPTGPYITM